MNLSAEVKQRISEGFNDEEEQQVIDALCDYKWLNMEPDRAHSVILDLSKGKISEVERLVKLANDDPKRILAPYTAIKSRNPTNLIFILVGINLIAWVVLKYIVQY